MKLISCLLLLACLAPLSAGGLLSTEQALAQLDDASAAEARWLFGTDTLAKNPLGIARTYTRAGIAYQRLLRGKNARVFEALAHSDNDVAACYGINGLGELAPDKLMAFLPDALLHRQEVQERSGIGGGGTCFAQQLGWQLGEHGINPDKEVVETAWRSFLEMLVTDGAGPVDSMVVGLVKTWLGSLPQPEPQPASLAYVLALNDYDSNAELRKLAIEDALGVSGLLAFSHLSMAQPWLTEWVVNDIWGHKLESPDQILNLRLVAEHWDSLADSMNDDEATSDISYDCLFQTLTDADWKWLASSQSTQVREAAARLSQNPITGWRIDADLPAEPAKRRHAKLCLLNQATKHSDRYGRRDSRAMYLLPAAVADEEQFFPFDAQWVDGRPALRALGRLLKPEEVCAPLISAASSKDWHTHISAIHALIHAGDDIKDRAALDARVPDLLRRLWKECDEAPEAERWHVRLLTLQLVSLAKFTELKAIKDRDSKWLLWSAELAKSLVSRPAVMPPNLDTTDLLTVSKQLGGRAADIIVAICEGTDEFLPVAERPDKRPDEETEPTPAVIYDRLKEAAAKLDD